MAVSGLAAGAPSSSGDALAMALSGLRWLGQADLTSAPTSVLADGLRGLENAESLLIAARASVLSAFDRHRGFEGDGAGSARSWLRWRTKVSNGSASASMAWMRRLRTHRLVADALASARVSGSWARRICAWTDLLPAGRRDEADAILLQAVADGAELPDLAIIAEELHARLADSASTGDPRSRGSGGGSDRGPGLGSDRDPGSGPGCGSDDRAANRAADQRSGSGCDDDRGRGVDHGTGGSADNDGKLWLAVTFGGAGRLEADLSPGCAAALRAVLDSLGKKAGPEDTRTVPQRQHDALYEALRRLIAVRNLPDRAGQPVQIQLHLSLEELLRRRGDSRPGTAWPSPAPGWPIAGAGEECDATIIPIVTGAIDYRLLDRLTRAVTSPLPGNAATQVRLNTDTVRDLIIANAAALLSGPRGLASWLRRRELAGIAGSVSLPLDTGNATQTIPPHLRRAVTLRDQHCAAPGCDQPPAACQVHHLKPRSQGGRTKLTNLLLLCTFHHLIAVHQWGFTITLNPDGTTTMTSPDGARVYHSHSPPNAA